MCTYGPLPPKSQKASAPWRCSTEMTSLTLGMMPVTLLPVENAPMMSCRPSSLTALFNRDSSDVKSTAPSLRSPISSTSAMHSRHVISLLWCSMKETRIRGIPAIPSRCSTISRTSMPRSIRFEGTRSPMALMRWLIAPVLPVPKDQRPGAGACSKANVKRSSKANTKPNAMAKESQAQSQRQHRQHMVAIALHGQSMESRKPAKTRKWTQLQ